MVILFKPWEKSRTPLEKLKEIKDAYFKICVASTENHPISSLGRVKKNRKKEKKQTKEQNPLYKLASSP